MIFERTTIETDPFLIEKREELNRLEAEKDATYKASDSAPTNISARIAYDAALMRWVHAKVAYERTLREVLGL
jgi:hypothetical protein